MGVSHEFRFTGNGRLVRRENVQNNGADPGRRTGGGPPGPLSSFAPGGTLSSGGRGASAQHNASMQPPGVQPGAPAQPPPGGNTQTTSGGHSSGD